MIAKTTKRGLTRGAQYIRMSSGKQERSPAQQKGENAKLAKAEKCEIVLTFSDEAITGDLGPEKRPGFRRMLEAAERGEFSVLLLENADRLGRFDSIAGAEYYNRLRNAGIRIVTAADGEIDLSTFEGRVVHTVRQEGRHAFLRDLSRKVLRGQVANAKAGNRNGGKPPYGMDRVLVDPEGKIVRRLADGETVKMPGHRVRQVLGTDETKLEALRYMFDRYGNSDISYYALAQELMEKGYPGPKGNGWARCSVRRVLINPAYRGQVRWGRRSTARYHTTQGDSIVPADGRASRPQEEAIYADSPDNTLIPAELFDKVQRKIAKRSTPKGRPRGDFPLSGLLYCEHCGQPMHGGTESRKASAGRKGYRRRLYVCSSYTRLGKRNAAGCGHFAIKADEIQAWLVGILQDVCAGPGREELVGQIKNVLQRRAKSSQTDTQRLEKRLAQLDRELGRLVKAIRTCDLPELVDELHATRADRDAVKVQLADLRPAHASADIQAEAEEIADTMAELGRSLDAPSPAALKEPFRRMVSKITCRWKKLPPKTPNGRCKNQLLGGTAILRPSLLDSLRNGAHAPAWERQPGRSHVL